MGTNPSETGNHRKLLSVAPSGAGLPRGLLWRPGGFLWWYLDLIDESGDGLVVIWSFGLPFLPGYAGSVRSGSPQTPQQRPSLNVSTYRQGKLDFYLLREFAPDDVEWQTSKDGDRWRFGDSRMLSEVRRGRRTVALDLRLDVPGIDDPVWLDLEATGPGVVREGASCHDPANRRDRTVPEHDWIPLLCAKDGRASLRIGNRVRRWRGRLYHDRNGGDRPLHELGIVRWMWARIPLPERDVVYYLIEGRSGDDVELLATIDGEGILRFVRNFDVERREQATTLGGLDWWPRCRLKSGACRDLRVECRHVVDSGPFYLRGLLEATDGDGRGHRGIVEVCEPDRIDLKRHRPLVEMRVDRREGNNSMWLPLFTGPRRGRVIRLFRSVFLKEG